MFNDRKGILVAVGCLVHCVAGPLLLSVAGFASLIGLSEKMEPVLLLTSLAIGCATLLPAYRKKHGRLGCLVIFVCGVFCLVARHHIQLSFLAETLATTAGANLIIGAHVLNILFSKRCACCNSESAEAADSPVRSGPDPV